MSKKRILPRALSAVAGVLLLTSLAMPLWQMKMEAPQYKDEDRLQVTIFPSRMAGDLDEIRVLNQYIGVHVPDQLPQLRWLPVALAAAAAMMLAAALLPRTFARKTALASMAIVLIALSASAGMAQWQMHQIGHDREQKTALVGVDNFTPPLLGQLKVANFQLKSQLGFGAYLLGAAVALQFATARLTGACRAKGCGCHARTRQPQAVAERNEVLA